MKSIINALLEKLVKIKQLGKKKQNNPSLNFPHGPNHIKLQFTANIVKAFLKLLKNTGNNARQHVSIIPA